MDTHMHTHANSCIHHTPHTHAHSCIHTHTLSLPLSQCTENHKAFLFSPSHGQSHSSFHESSGSPSSTLPLHLCRLLIENPDVPTLQVLSSDLSLKCQFVCLFCTSEEISKATSYRGAPHALWKALTAPAPRQSDCVEKIR